MTAALALGLLQAATAGVAGAQTPAAAATAARPPQAQCAAVRDVDFRTLAREQARAVAANPPRTSDMLDVVRIPDRAARRPPEDAPVVIRARMPPGGGHGSEHRAVVWREADGSWWFWRHSVNEGPPAPPQLPPDAANMSNAEINAWMAEQRVGRTDEERWWPPKEGRLSARRTAEMEAAWSDPCRAWDPDWWPHDLPLNRRIDGSRRRLCPQDSSVIFGEMVEAGGPRRRVGGACINDTPTWRMIQNAAYAAGDPAR